MPGGISGLFPGIEKHHQSDEYKQWKAEEDLLHEVGRDRLVELAQAETDGRLVVLPCKAGDPVWWIDVDWLPQDGAMFYKISSGKFRYAMLDWNSSIYTSQAEAEAALKKREDA